MSWTVMWAMAARMLWLTGPNQRGGRWRATASTARLRTAPARLRKKPGARNCPRSRLPATTRRSTTQAASRQPQRASTTRVTMLPRPGFTPGRGSGMAASATVRAMAAAAWRATRLSSGVGTSSIVEGVIVGAAAGEGQGHVVGGADGHRAGTREPALAHAVLARAGVGSDPRAAGLDFHPGDAQGARHFHDLRPIQGQAGEHRPAGTDFRPVRRTAAPQPQEGVAGQTQAQGHHQPVAGPQEGQPLAGRRGHAGGVRGARLPSAARRAAERCRTRVRTEPPKLAARRSAKYTERCWPPVQPMATVSEERRVGKECRSRWSPYH